MARLFAFIYRLYILIYKSEKSNLVRLSELHKYFISIDKMKSSTIRKMYLEYKSLDKLTQISPYEQSFFSQNGEDGIILEIFKNIDTVMGYAIEIGAGGYSSNVLVLWAIFGWDIILIDGSEDQLNETKRLVKDISYKYNLNSKNKPIFIKEWIYPDKNFSRYIAKHIDSQKVSLLSLDIDGLDYYVLNNLDILPEVIVCEYNASFGNENKITVPPEPDFYRYKYDKRGWHAGASLPAIKSVLEKKGYTFLGVESSGINSFFVRNDMYTNRLDNLMLSKFMPHKFRTTSYDQNDQESYLREFNCINLDR